MPEYFVCIVNQLSVIKKKEMEKVTRMPQKQLEQEDPAGWICCGTGSATALLAKGRLPKHIPFPHTTPEAEIPLQLYYFIPYPLPSPVTFKTAAKPSGQSNGMFGNWWVLIFTSPCTFPNHIRKHRCKLQIWFHPKIKHEIRNCTKLLERASTVKGWF